MSWKPEFQVVNDDNWYSNAQCFATEQEAYDSAAARFQVWTASTGFRAVASTEPVNYARVDGRDVMINREELK